MRHSISAVEMRSSAADSSVEGSKKGWGGGGVGEAAEGIINGGGRGVAWAPGVSFSV